MSDEFKSSIEDLKEANNHYISKIESLKESEINYATMARNCRTEINLLKDRIDENNIVIAMLKMRNKELEEDDEIMAQINDSLSP